MSETLHQRAPRPVRLNNPCAIRISSIPWQGKIVPSADPEFETFESPFFGIRAAARNFLTYFEKYKLNTVTGLIGRHAPSNENDTAAYIHEVCQETGFAASEQLDLGEPETLFDIVKAVMHYESGQVCANDSEIMAAVRAAYA
jgi:hypothetical protein